MGDRALVIFHDEIKNSDEVTTLSPVIYLHWAGHAVPQYLVELRKMMKGRGGDVAYTSARFTGLCHSKNPDSNTGLGLWNNGHTLKEYRRDGHTISHGDAGVFLINCNTWEVENYAGYGDEQLAEEWGVAEKGGFFIPE